MRRRQSERPSTASSSDVPAELLDHNSETWLDVRAFDEWSVETFGRKLPVTEHSSSPYHRFAAAVQEWAGRHDLMSERLPTLPDWDRLAEIGVRRMLALKRCELNWLHQARYGPGIEARVTVEARTAPQ